MKFDPFNFVEVEKPNGKTIKRPAGKLQVLCTEDAQVFIAVQGYEALAGCGTEIKVEISEPYELRIKTKGRVFVNQPPVTVIKSEGEIFTNADRMPMESGTVLEVAREMRRFKLEQRQILRDMRAEHQELRRTRRAPAPVPDDEPAPTPVVDEPADDQAAE